MASYWQVNDETTVVGNTYACVCCMFFIQYLAGWCDVIICSPSPVYVWCARCRLTPRPPLWLSSASTGDSQNSVSCVWHVLATTAWLVTSNAHIVRTCMYIYSSWAYWTNGAISAPPPAPRSSSFAAENQVWNLAQRDLSILHINLVCVCNY